MIISRQNIIPYNKVMYRAILCSVALQCIVTSHTASRIVYNALCTTAMCQATTYLAVLHSLETTMLCVSFTFPSLVSYTHIYDAILFVLLCRSMTPCICITLHCVMFCHIEFGNVMHSRLYHLQALYVKCCIAWYHVTLHGIPLYPSFCVFYYDIFVHHMSLYFTVQYVNSCYAVLRYTRLAIF